MLVTLVVATALFPLGVLAAPAASAESKKVLMSAESLASWYGEAAEVTAAKSLGFDVDIKNESEWRALTTADFASYQAIVVGDPACGVMPQYITDTGATWGPAVMGTQVNSAPGNRIVIGTDPVYHRQGDLPLYREGISFAAMQPGRTGLYLTASCYAGEGAEALLDSLSNGSGAWSINYSPPCGGSAALVADHPSFATLASSQLQEWYCSIHMTFPTFPSDWTPLAVATDAATQPVCGSDKDTGAAACGEAYILIAGSGIVATAPDIEMTPATQAVADGAPATITATLSRDGSPLVGVPVAFSVAGANDGVTGTCAPASCVTGADGTVSFTYTGTNAGEDTVFASFTDNGAKQTASAAVARTAAPSNTGPTVEVTGAEDGGTYEIGDEPTAACAVTDAEDGDSTFAAEVTELDGPLAAYGVGSQTATCEYTDEGGLSASASATYSIADTGAPTLSGAPETSPNAAGWYRSPVSIEWTASDSGVGIAAAPGDSTLGEGANQRATATVTDRAGNATTADSDPAVNVDLTAPTVVWTGGSTYGIDQTVALTCSASDALSGVSSSSCGGASGAATTYDVGTNTVTKTVYDAAGNSTTKSATFTVTVSSSSLCGLVRKLVSSTDVADGLCSKLAAAAKSSAPAKANQLNAFRNQLDAQTGKSVSAANAALLKGLLQHV